MRKLEYSRANLSEGWSNPRGGGDFAAVAAGNNNNKKGRQKYVDQTLVLHQVIVAAMKSKQTTDLTSCDTLSHLIQVFSNSYFDEHGLKHL